MGTARTHRAQSNSVREQLNRGGFLVNSSHIGHSLSNTMRTNNISRIQNIISNLSIFTLQFLFKDYLTITFPALPPSSHNETITCRMFFTASLFSFLNIDISKES